MFIKTNANDYSSSNNSGFSQVQRGFQTTTKKNRGATLDAKRIVNRSEDKKHFGRKLVRNPNANNENRFFEDSRVSGQHIDSDSEYMFGATIQARETIRNKKMIQTTTDTLSRQRRNIVVPNSGTISVSSNKKNRLMSANQ